MRRSLFAGFIMMALFNVPVTPRAFAQAPQASPPASGKWTVDDLVMAETAGGAQISPDNRFVVWVKNVADKEKNERVSNLVLSSLTEKREVELTRGTDSSFGPKWSPDGQLIAFVSARPAPKAKPGDSPKPQLWLINPFGGEPWQLTSFARGVTNLEWADPDTIIFSAQEDPSLYENEIKEKKDTSIMVEDEEHAPPVRLFKFSIKSKKLTRLTDNADRIQSFTLSPDGSKAVTVHDRSMRFVYDNKIKPAVFLYDLGSGERRQIFEDRRFNIGRVRWARDGRGFYAASELSSHPEYLNATITELYFYDLATGAPVKVNLAWENGLAGGVEVTGKGFLALLANGARHRAARYTREGASWRREWIEGDHARNIFGLQIGRDDETLVLDYSTASTPAQIYRARLNGANLEAVVQVSDINQQLKKKTIARTEVIKWKGARDEEVEGILYYPHDFEPGRKYPLVVMPHGGPAAADFDSWSDRMSYPHNLVAQRGAFILKPNYHGSSNYGLKWVESIGGGKYYDLEVPDIEKGVDYLIDRGLVDPDRLGAMGWSNGAILTIALTVTTDRYKVASAGAGDVDWTSDWGNAHFGASFDNYYFGKSPLEDPKLYIDKSPFYKLDRVRTPTIIFFGTEDTNVPTQQGWMHYRALQQIGKADVRFVLFPGERHGIVKLVHQKRKLEEEMSWLDKYLFKTLSPENEAFRPDSPLAIALKLKKARSDGQRFGLAEKGLLIPETVKYNGIEVGRFEITRAQFAQFDRGYKVEPGKENFPANNITFEQARAYVGWLSSKTGLAYRLPTEAEAEAIYSTPAGPENTLDYWAGYSLNPEDAARLKQKISELGGSASLLKEVGSFKGTGSDDPVFDLGGNVAEWVVSKDGGRVMGGSADTPVDAKLRVRRPAPEYIGFRVARDASAAAASR
ncbi:MAG TPA: prolyl oligopeptidase family serine peptidase [Blastocatellia bacterium]|jgi:dipeptidyl aminopeptidase/acylaminoacyl peptidase|nr:prolyl oligopeptidase family serine peptidase [Blastocatellia bacterium]